MKTRSPRVSPSKTLTKQPKENVPLKRRKQPENGVPLKRWKQPENGVPLKRRKLSQVPASVALDFGVQVIVRMRPPSKEDDDKHPIVQKISPNSVFILDHTFSFDYVADTGSTQNDIFQIVGLPLVENCIAGFNSSIFAYGQTGSGKTYTMWGPTSALSADSLSKQWGLSPRIFERLFFRISEEEAKHSEKNLNYQCHCSCLEIYNDQITDLLDPIQRNLRIREDVRTGVYVDSLTEEYVRTGKDVIQLLLKGLTNRRTGATSINVESSRSHFVFTCVVESRSKSMDDGLSSVRISRINLVDLVGSERQKLTGAMGERLKEAGNINRSLSQLGKLINILAEVSESGKQKHIPYRDSRLTFLLQESLGGNAKLAMICAVSPSQSCKSETFSTLRFAQRAKTIKNKAVVNDIPQDDVNVLREQIRQLKVQQHKYERECKFYANEPISAPPSTTSRLAEESTNEEFEQERRRWTETESKWISLSEEQRVEIEKHQSLAEKLKLELDYEKKCTMELKEGLQTAIQGYAQILEQHAELQENHIALLGRHRKIRDGIADVKRAAAKVGVKGAESKLIDSLAAEISALKAEREKERRYWRDKNKGLQAQFKDTAAIPAVGELLVWLKEAEEAAAIAQGDISKIQALEEKAEQLQLQNFSCKVISESIDKSIWIVYGKKLIDGGRTKRYYFKCRKPICGAKKQVDCFLADGSKNMIDLGTHTH